VVCRICCDPFVHGQHQWVSPVLDVLIAALYERFASGLNGTTGLRCCTTSSGSVIGLIANRQSTLSVSTTAIRWCTSGAVQRVVIEGWLHRGLRPYIEMSNLTTEDGITKRAWSRWVQYILAFAAIVAGYFWMYAAR
jgi:hypothetical protein